MPDLHHSQSAFYEPGASLTLPFTRDGAIDITEVRPYAMTLLCGRADTSPLPLVNNVRVPSPDCRIYGMAPDRWLAVYSSAPSTPVQPFEHIEYEYPSSKLFSVDHGSAWACLCLAGEKVRDVIQRLCPVDVHPSVFGDGDCFQSKFSGSPVLVDYAGNDEFRVFVPRSSARAMLEDVCDAALRA